MRDFPSIPMTTEETIEFDKWLEGQNRKIRTDAIEEYRLALHKKYADNKYLYENNTEYWNLDMGEVDEIAEQLKEQNK